MTNHWRLVIHGLAIAILGAIACMLFFVGVSALFVGRFTLAQTTLAISVVFAVGFHRFIGHYLNLLDERERVEEKKYGSKVMDKLSTAESVNNNPTNI